MVSFSNGGAYARVETAQLVMEIFVYGYRAMDDLTNDTGVKISWQIREIGVEVV
jgi:hypothetical protein